MRLVPVLSVFLAACAPQASPVGIDADPRCGVPAGTADLVATIVGDLVDESRAVAAAEGEGQPYALHLLGGSGVFEGTVAGASPECAPDPDDPEAVGCAVATDEGAEVWVEHEGSPDPLQTSFGGWTARYPSDPWRRWTGHTASVSEELVVGGLDLSHQGAVYGERVKIAFPALGITVDGEDATLDGLPWATLSETAAGFGADVVALACDEPVSDPCGPDARCEPNR